MAKRKHPTAKSLRQGQTVYLLMHRGSDPKYLFVLPHFMVSNKLAEDNDQLWREHRFWAYRKCDVHLLRNRVTASFDYPWHGTAREFKQRLFYSRKTAQKVARRMTKAIADKWAALAAGCVLIDLESSHI